MSPRSRHAGAKPNRTAVRQCRRSRLNHEMPEVPATGITQLLTVYGCGWVHINTGSRDLLAEQADRFSEVRNRWCRQWRLDEFPGRQLPVLAHRDKELRSDPVKSLPISC